MATPHTARSTLARQETIEELTRSPLDLLVIGGGIVGSGIARDAAMRGLSVGLVDQDDFASGTSSRSSRLLHGGLRYLAQGRLGLVREASTEKRIIHRIAPHLADPLPFIFPVHRGNKDWALWQLKIGVKIYDFLGQGRSWGKSTWLHPEEVMENLPSLDESGLLGAVRYYDALTNDARLTLDTLRAAARHTARLLNYCRFKSATRHDRWTCVIEDRRAREDAMIDTRAVVNATGPWAEGLSHSTIKLRLTKGIHLVVNHARLPVPEAVVMTEGERILFAIPWGERTILGTTDTDYAGPLDQVMADAEDVDYVLRVTNRMFPRAPLTTADVVSTWAGLRPLIAARDGKPSAISRTHEIRNPQPGWWDVAGGKLTTYRLMAEQTVDQISEWLRQSESWERPIHPCRTADELLLPETAGPRFNGIIPPEVTREAVQHYCAEEWAIHLEDVMVRRAGWHYYHRDAAAIAQQVAAWMAEILGWPPDTHAAELDRYRQLTPTFLQSTESPKLTNV